MSKTRTAGPSASAGVAGNPESKGDNPEVSNAKTELKESSETGQADQPDGDAANQVNSASVEPSADASAGAAGENVEKADEASSGDVANWAASLEYPHRTIVRNNGHIGVAEPETAQFVGGGSLVHVVLQDEGHAARVFLNTIELNKRHFHGERKVRLDAAPDDLYEVKG